jgi:hypothetical protein
MMLLALWTETYKLLALFINIIVCEISVICVSRSTYKCTLCPQIITLGPTVKCL